MLVNSKQRIFSSKYAPDPKLNVLWMDLTEDPDGSVIKYFDRDTETYKSISGIGQSDPGEDGKNGRSPYISSTNTWMIYSDTTGEFIDSGVKATGLTGDTYTPSVSAEGVISWSNNGGLPNPSSVSVKGSDGKTAYQSAVSGGYTGTESEFNAKLAAGLDTITTTEGTAISVGYIPAGSNLSGKTIMQVVDQMLYKELYPTTLSDPSSSFGCNVPLIQKIGSVLTINFTTSFSRGLISPAYGTSGFRSGQSNLYEYTGTGLTNVSGISAGATTNSQSVQSYTILSGSNTWTSKVYYSQGERPLSSRGNEYSAQALPAGSTSIKTIIIDGVHPVYATLSNTNSVSEVTPLTAYGLDIVVTLAKEESFSGVLKKQKILIPKSWRSNGSFITQAYQKDETTGLYGTTNIINTFTAEPGSGIYENYNIYSHNGGQIGSRTIKFKS